jgi:hypothetical protein
VCMRALAHRLHNETRRIFSLGSDNASKEHSQCLP